MDDLQTFIHFSIADYKHEPEIQALYASMQVIHLTPRDRPPQALIAPFVGPALVPQSLVPTPSFFHIRGIRNDKVVQDCPLTDLIYDVPRLIVFLTEGTPLPPGTVILTGTPPGAGVAKKARPGYLVIDSADVFVELTGSILKQRRRCTSTYQTPTSMSLQSPETSR
ncbi:uncharacterized protein A1O5_12330 [Cladophialophora psammophila CBS 110553]|uniref:Fumarylacetoacetase-like C-terminal domain-containing protein n=1 Tax=Cladophialophora psammophila CBS 110553 TaxID=1182543 RepID=W9VPX1_9EURO|nr:uncharacterized protein A1O5_12330 [Cladophialophora psammophila CBS 110553]EXJ57772.1 hypothetical protein A1O5_12330 [Cladophialophora psammophila CBS 110553]